MAKKPGMTWNEETQQWDRTEEYSTKIFLDAFEEHVVLDAHVHFVHINGKLKARCRETNTNLQFPSMLRRAGRELIADVIKAKNSGGRVFYRVYRGSIRDGNEIVG